MKKLSYEDGHLVLRNLDGTLFWSSHWVDMKGSCVDCSKDGGYKTILISGELIEQSDFSDEKKLIL